MGFTVNQDLAITTPGNIIVSAGAGSGKTTVMIARIIEKLKAGASLDDMLIVTFTRASAADMRIKLTEKLFKLKNTKTDEKRDVADAALEKLPTSNIGTLHSYCQRLVRMYFYAADLDPSAVLCEEGEADAMKLRAVTDAVDRAWETGDPYFITMYDMLCSRRSDDAVKKAVGNILDFALTMPDPDAYLSVVRPDSDFFAELDGMVNCRRTALLADIAEITPALAAAGMARHVKKADELTAYINGYTDKVSLPKKTEKDNSDLHDKFSHIKEECVELVEFATEIEQAKHVDSAPYSKALLTVAADAYRRYVERKKALGKMDFSDLEHGAYRVLRDSACMSEIKKSVKYVFIDEFQDVNPLQSAIAEAFRAGGAEMFVVGDVKQSIYGFRRCSPEHFKRAIAAAKPLGVAGDAGAYTHIPLTDNFRSAQAVINFVNDAFDGVMTAEFGGVDYSDEAQRLKWGNTDMVGGKAVFYAVGDEVEKPQNDSVVAIPADKSDKFGGYSVVNDSDGMSAEHNEAVLVANCVVDIIKNSPDPKAGSIAVLVRSVKSDFCRALTAELDRREIKYKVGGDRKAKAFPEIVALTDILRCADNRLDDVALYTAMRSSMGGFSDEQLAAVAEQGEKACRDNNVAPIRGGRRKSYALWQKIEAYRGALKDKVDMFIAARDRIVKYAHTHDCADVLGFITSEFDYFQHVYETHGSAAAVDSLIRFAADRGCDMHTFIEYYDNSKIELAADGGGDAVTITTVHKSKGLEYDHVIVADTAKKFNEQDKSQRVLISENGVFVKLPVAGSKKLAVSAPWKMENILYPARARAEELRLLYVALTRAKHTLIVTGMAKKLKRGKPINSNCMMNFLPEAIKASTDEVPNLPIGGAVIEYPFDADIAAAVAARHKQAEEYNAQRAKSALPVKTCVTAAIHSEGENADYTSVSPVLTVDDRDRTGQAGDVMLRGTAYHRAMELVDFDDPDMEKLRGECENFHLVNESEIKTAAAVMSKLVGDGKCVRERYFIVDLPAAQVYGNKSLSDNVLVQGVIDLLIVDNAGGVTIIDYKTGNPSSLVNDGYKKQLALYSAAVERCTPYRVKRAALYSFSAGKLIDL